MREFFVYHLVSGHAFFSAGAVLLAIFGLDLAGLWVRRPRWQYPVRVVVVASVVCAGLSGTPVSMWLLVPLLASIILFCVVNLRRERKGPRREWARLLLTAGNTLDGIHLSPQGHESMVELLVPWLGGNREHLLDGSKS